MAKKGTKFNRYSIETKLEAVRLYLEEGLGYQAVAQRLGLRSKTQVEIWVKRHKEEKSFMDKRIRPPQHPGKFNSLEEELAYYKMENAYLKKRNPNLHGEGSWTNEEDLK